MQILFHRQFRKAWKRQPAKIQKQFKVRLGIFEQNPYDPILRNHALAGKHRGKRSINVTGDVRAIYVVYEYTSDSVIFIDIGTHSDLYG